MKTNRRRFLQYGGVAPLGMLLTASSKADTGPKTSFFERIGAARRGTPDALRGFIVSDVHFGWRHPSQPQNAVINQLIGHILQKFDDLDIFLDTGDIHHRDADDHGRRDWTNILANGVWHLPFFVAAGNHETMNFAAAKEDGREPEERVMQLCNIPCRPYYSATIKGIHLVFLPQLLDVNLVTREALSWLELDLTVHRQQTVLIFTHNALAGTTQSHDSKVYRQIANSQEVLEILDKHPQVLAWMHGHNHTWEIVEKDGRLYVSNGRLGGFSPSFPGHYGEGHLGGIYFEVTKDRFVVRGYSATHRCFFDELPGYAHMTQTLSTKTSFDPHVGASVCWGVGAARDGLRTPAYQHYLGAPGSETELFVADEQSPVFSENSNFYALAEETQGWSRGCSIAGLSVNPIQDVDGQIDGIRLEKNRIVLLPLAGQETRSLFSPKKNAQMAYYRCAPNHSYRARATVSADEDGPAAQIIITVFDHLANPLHRVESPLEPLSPQPRQLQAVLYVPASAAKGTIYENPDSDKALSLGVELRLTRLTAPATVYRLEVAEEQTDNAAQDAGILVGSEKIVFRRAIEKDHPARARITQPLKARQAIETIAAGKRGISWLIRQNNVLWQIRNAIAEQTADGTLCIGPIRNQFANRHEIVLAPIPPISTPFVHYIIGINRCRIEPYNAQRKEFRIYVDEFLGNYQEIQFLNVPGPISFVDNVGHRAYQSVVPHSAGVQPQKPGWLTVRF